MGEGRRRWIRHRSREKTGRLRNGWRAPEAVESSSTGASSSSQPAADWICVAAARNVLVVDDNDRHLDILSTILTSVGHDVETCGSGAEALRRLDMRHYEVVVLDLVMPGSERAGRGAADAQLHAQPDTRRVIICTANMTTGAPAAGGCAGDHRHHRQANRHVRASYWPSPRAPIRERAHDRRSDQIRICRFSQAFHASGAFDSGNEGIRELLA